MNVSVVIPNWKGRKLLAKHLPRVMEAALYRPNQILEVIVVDDASPDDSNKFLAESYPRVKLVRHEVNRGFAAAVNTGVRAASGDLVCLLNVDVSPAKDFLEPVLPHFKDEEVFGVSLAERGYSWARGWFKEGFFGHGGGSLTRKAHLSFWVSGGSGVFRKSVWETMGGMDEELFGQFYWEDVDLSYRAAKRGYELWWEPAAKVVHEHESVISPNFSRSKLTLAKERNELLFTWKNLSSEKLFKKHLEGVVRRVLRHPGYVKVVILAFSRLFLVLKRRWQEKREMKVTDEEILARFAN